MKGKFMRKLYASTGAFLGRANERNFYLLGDVLPKIRCDGFEFMFFDGYYCRLDSLIGFLKDSGAAFPTFHVDKKIGEFLAQNDFTEAFRLFAINCDTARKIGSSLLVLHLWNGLISDSNIGANFSALETLEKISHEHGLTLTCENVLAHYHTPLTLLKRLSEESPSVLFTYDTKMADFDNENAVALDGKQDWLWERVRHIHLNDRKGAFRDWNSIRALHIGEGNIDFGAVFDYLGKINYCGDFTLEAASLDADGSIHPERTNQSLEILRGYIKGMPKPGD